MEALYKQLLLCTLVLMLGLWGYLQLRLFLESRKNTRADLDKIEKLHRNSRFLRFCSFGIILLLPAFIVSFIPTVTTVCPIYRGAGFKVENKYVPFVYKGHFCSPFTSYVSNETDSLLVLYSSVFYGGTYVSGLTGEVGKFHLPAGSFIMWNKGIDNEFVCPEAKYRYSNDVEDVQWTLDTESGTARSMNKLYEDSRKPWMYEEIVRRK